MWKNEKDNDREKRRVRGRKRREREIERRKKSAFVLYVFPVQGVLCACAHVDIPRTKAKK